MHMRRGEMLCEVAGFAGTLQADEDYDFRHRSNLGGRAPCTGEPATGT
jgi:hypothetical protein